MNTLLTVKDVSELLSVKKPRVYELANMHAIPGVILLGRRQIRFSSEIVRRWLETGEAPVRRESTTT